jgi:hypothetical protein
MYGIHRHSHIRQLESRYSREQVWLYAVLRSRFTSHKISCLRDHRQIQNCAQIRNLTAK